MSVPVLILAAGSSRRMGRPKALLDWQGESFLARIVRVFAEGGAAPIVVVVGGDHATEIEAEARGLTAAVEIVPNPEPGDGPITSVRRGISALPKAVLETGGGILLHPVDIPGLDVADVIAILDTARTHPEASAVVPSVGMRRGHPLFLRTKLARQLLEEPPRHASVRELLREPGVGIEHVLRENRGLLRDFDTPQDLE